MAQPTRYNRAFNFANQQALTPSTPIPASQVEAELNRVKLTTDEIITNLGLIQRDDGALMNQVVDVDQLTPLVLSIISQSGGLIDVPMYDSRAAFAFANVGAAIQSIQTNGYSTPGDGGGARYKRVDTEPAHEGKVQSADGAWWELAEPVVSVLMLGAKGDGTDDTAPINDATAIGWPVYFPKPPVKYAISGPLVLASGSTLYADEKVLIETSAATIISANGLDDVSLRNLVFRGAHNGTSYHVTLTDCERWKFAGVEFENGNSGIDVVGGADHEWTDLVFRNIRGTCVKLRSSFVRGTFRGVHSKNVRNFTILVEDASRIDIYDLRRWYDASDITTYLSGEVVSGRLGNEALGVRYSGSYVRLFGYNIEDVNENSISFTGSNNEAHGGRVNNGANTGIHLYGRSNLVVGAAIRGCLAAGVQISANAGGIARRNKVVGVNAEANLYGIRTSPDAYATWSSGGSTSTSYCKSVSGANTRIYESASGTVTTFGTVQPVHESGTVSDGVNNWTYVARVTNSETLDARENTIIGCTANDNSSGDFVDSTAAAALNTFTGNGNDAAVFGLAPGTGTMQQTVVSDSLSPQFNQRRKLATGNGDVGSGAVIAKWDGSGWLNGAFRIAARAAWFVHSASGSILRAKFRINVTNAAGTDWTAFELSEEGYVGIGNASTFTPNDPSCSLDVDGQVAGNSIGMRARTNVTISSNDIVVTGIGWAHVTATGTINTLTTTDPYAQRVFITAAAAVTITHSSSLRCRGGTNITLAASQGGVEFIKLPGSAVWEQVG